MFSLVDTCPVSYKVLITHGDSRDSTPQYVVMGDVNNDTHLDILVVTTGLDTIKILLSQGNGTFIDHLTLSTGLASRPSSAAFGHFNHDRCLDVAVANYASHSIIIFIGDCHGQFHNHSIYSTGPSRPIIIKVGDLNDDESLDLVITNNGTDSFSVLLGHGDGTFADPVRYSTAFDSFPHDIAIGDVDNDGTVDLIVANYGTDNVGIHFGYGNGSFAPQMTLWTGPSSGPYSIALADLNEDHHLDIVVANIGTGSVTLFLNYENGAFVEKLTVSTNISGPVQLVIGDLNGDMHKDLAIVSAWNNIVCVVLGYSNGTFGEQLSYSTDLNSEPWSLALADVNHDNRTDVVVANHGTNNVGVLLGYNPGLFQNQTTYSTGEKSYPWSAVLDDVNNDQILDIINVHTGSGHMGIFIGYGDGTFADEVVYSTGSDSEPYALTTGDFNGDSRLDIVVANTGTGNIGIFLGYGNGTFQRQKTCSTGRASGPKSVDVGDFNRDSHLDIVVANEGTENVGLFLGYGNGSFAKQRTFSTGNSSRPMSIVVADFNSDQRLDIAVANYDTCAIGIFLGYGTGKFTEQRTYSSIPHRPTMITTSDMNNDNQTDIIFTTKNDEGENIAFFLGVGDGNFQIPLKYPAGDDSSPYGLSIGDLNNDNYQDIVLANANPENMGILFGYGDGTFAHQQVYPTGKDSYPTSIALGDLNNDTQLDIVVVNFIGCRIDVFLSYMYGALTNPHTYSTGSSTKPQSVVQSDFNSDNQLDIIVANSGTDTVSIYLQSSNRTLANEVSYPTGTDSLPNSVITSDFNKDSMMDIAVVNSGNDNIGLFLNRGDGTFGMGTFFSTGSDSQPCAIAAGNLNNDTYIDLVVTNYAAGNIGVFLGYKYPHHQMTAIYSIMSRTEIPAMSIADLNNDNHTDIVIINSQIAKIIIFLGYGDGTFAAPLVYPFDARLQSRISIIDDFNNDNQLDIVICFEAHTLATYLGYGNGTMSSPNYYYIENRFQLTGIFAADFNNDSRMDVALLAISEIAYVIIVFGQGDGTFVNQTFHSTGLILTFSSMAVGDFNNDHQLDIVITNDVDNKIEILLGHGNGSFAVPMTYSTGEDSEPQSVTVGDCNNDNLLDIVITFHGLPSIGIFFGYGNGSFRDQKTYSIFLSVDSKAESVVIGDFNSDNFSDIAVPSVSDSKIIVLLGYPNEIFQMTQVYDTGYESYPNSIVAVDLNHDRVLDIIVTNSYTGTMAVFLGSCCDLFVHQTTFSTGIDSGPHSVTLGDFNSDGILDVAVANLRAENIGVLLGHGNGSFDEQIIYPTGLGSRPYALVVGDCNNDTYLDIFVANYGTETIGVLIGYDNGTFVEYVTYSTGLGSRPNAITVLDFNNDNRLDIAITNDGTNNIAILFGDGNGNFGGLITYQTGYNTQPCAIASGDYNNDGEMDIFVSECGSNSIGVISKFC